MDGVASSGSEAEETTLGSGLVIDIDHRSVRAILFDLVEGHGRFVAGEITESTLPPPIADPSVAVHTVLHGIEAETGRTMFADESDVAGMIGYQSPDYIVVTGNLVKPNRFAIIPIGTHPILPSLTGVSRTTSTVVRVLSDQVRNEDGGLAGVMLEDELSAFQPDTVLLLAGDRTQQEWSTAAGTLKDMFEKGAIEQIIVLASEQLQQQVAQAMGEDANLTGLDPGQFSVDEVASAIGLELQSMYESRVATEAAGIIPGTPVFVSRGRAIDLVARFLARWREQPVIVTSIDDGVLIAGATAQASWSVQRPEYDTSLHAIAAMGMDLRRITQLLPFTMSNEDLNHWLLNRSLRPSSVADSRRDQLIESAVATEMLRSAWSDIESVAESTTELIVGSPLFASWFSPALGVMSLLNAFEPRPASGLVEIVLDAEGIVPAAGALGEMSPALASDAVEHDLLMPTASVIVMQGSGTEGDLAVTGRIVYESGETASFTVPYGSLHAVPLGDGEPATLTLECEPGFSVGGSADGESVEFGSARPLRGGPLGVIIDARGRPVSGVADLSSAANRVSSWYADLGVSHLTT